MRAVLQRVTQASCAVEGKITGEIENGFLVLLGIEDADTQEDLEWLAQKIANMRVFGDENDWTFLCLYRHAFIYLLRALIIITQGFRLYRLNIRLRY